MDPALRTLLLRLTRPDGRRGAAKSLAERVGADELIIFAPDLEVQAVLPAPGFQQTLSDARAWRTFLDSCVGQPVPHAGTVGGRRVVGIRTEEGTVLALLGGAPNPAACEEIAAILPFIGAALEAERQAMSNLGHARVAREAAAHAEALTASLARTQSVLNTALRELHEKQEWLSATLKSIGDAVVVTDANCKVVFLNAVASTLIGWSVAEARGKQLDTVFQLFDEETRAPSKSPVERAMHAGEIFGLEKPTYLLRKDGTEIFIEDSAAPIHNEHHVVTGAVLVFRDVTQRRKLEADQKVQRVKEREARDFEQQLIGIVSHDLRNPLSAVLISAGQLENLVSEPLPQRLLRRIISSGQRADRLVRDLLDFTQARLGGGIEVNPKAMVLKDVVKQVVDEARLSAPGRTIEVIEDAGASGHWDADRIAQVLSNLLGNALRYSPEDSVVTLRTYSEPTQVVIEVHNRGEPIPPALLPKLFEPMKRGAERSDNQARSIGLGLYIVRSVLAAHRATVSVQSSAALGTTFTVQLPR